MEDDNTKDISMLFESISEHFKDADDSMKEMFSMLVDTTLKYRDTLVHSNGIPFTVGETREALDLFMRIIKEHSSDGASIEILKSSDKRVKGLVMIWLEKLKDRVVN